MKKGITTEEWNQIEAMLKEKGIDPKPVLKLWNAAMRKVAAAAHEDGSIDGQIYALEGIAMDMQQRNQNWTTTIQR